MFHAQLEGTPAMPQERHGPVIPAFMLDLVGLRAESPFEGVTGLVWRPDVPEPQGLKRLASYEPVFAPEPASPS